MIERVIVAGGGTGGHLFPGIAVVEELERRAPGLCVSFVGTERGIESRVVPQLGAELDLLEVSPLKGMSAAKLLRSLGKLPVAYAEAVRILRRRKPDVVIGVGGYASGPMLVAAKSMGIPTALLEQNAHVGLTNRVLASVIGRAYVTFPETASMFGARARVVGNPVRRAFVDAARLALSDPDAFELKSRRIFVLGGSQGAKALNDHVPGALAALSLPERGISVLHQTGAAMQAQVQERYRALGIDAEVVAFVDDMARAYASAQLVIARAGATTLAEICAIGRPSILVPYPHAADDHQSRNAEALEREGAAIAIAQVNLSAETLAARVEPLLTDATRRRAMGAAARSLGRPEAAAAIVDDLFAWLGGPATSRAGSAPRAGSSEQGGKGGGGFELATVDFRAGRGGLELRRSTRPPAPRVRLEPVAIPHAPRGPYLV